jgi:hypothetical protein
MGLFFLKSNARSGQGERDTYLEYEVGKWNSEAGNTTKPELLCGRWLVPLLVASYLNSTQ